jgi:hypothetical protein
MFAALVTCGVFASPALAERDLSLRFSADDTGNITVVGNTLMTCPSSATGCVDARQGTGSGSGLNNNSYTCSGWTWTATRARSPRRARR